MQLFLPLDGEVRVAEVFMQIQLAKRIEIDLLELLVRVKHAFKTDLEFASSVDYATFLAASSNDAKREHESTVNAHDDLGTCALVLPGA